MIRQRRDRDFCECVSVSTSLYAPETAFSLASDEGETGSVGSREREDLSTDAHAWIRRDRDLFLRLLIPLWVEMVIRIPMLQTSNYPTLRPIR